MKRSFLLAFVLSCILQGCGGSEFEGKSDQPQGGNTGHGENGGASDAQGGGANEGGSAGSNVQTSAGGQPGGSYTRPYGRCTKDGKIYANGETFDAPDGCNTCTCTAGTITCTEKTCPVTCDYSGVTYQLNETFKAIDGCTDCKCTETGVACDNLSCAVTN